MPGRTQTGNMANKILYLSQHPDLVRQYEKNVMKYFQAKHSFDMMKEKYSKLIEDLITDTNK